MKIFNKFLFIIILLQIAFIGVFILEYYLDINSINILLLRQIIGFIYFIFIPGFLILKVLKIDNLNFSRLVIYSIGLSLFFITGIATLINFIYPLFGISKPISEKTLLITLNIFILALILYILHKEKIAGTTYPYFNDNIANIIKSILKPQILIFLLIPFLAIFGSYLLSFYNNNTLILITICIILLIPTLVALNKIPNKLYPLLIVISAFVLLSYNNFVGMYIRPTDAVYEFYFIKLVINNGFWNYEIKDNLNSMLNVAILPATLSILLNIPLTWVYKVIAPILSLTVPAGLYQIYKTKWDEKIAFFATFFYISMFTYYTWCAVTMKMLFAGIYLVLLFVVILDKNLNQLKKLILLILFSFSLIVSHYGTSYILMISIIIAIFIRYLLEKLLNITYENIQLTKLTFIMFYTITAISWYIFVGSSSAYYTIINLGKHICTEIQKLYLPKSTATVLIGEWSMSIQILKLLYIIAVVFIVIGLLNEIRKSKTVDEILLISLPFLGFLFFNYAFVGYYVGRIWYIVSILLAPYCILGISTVYDLLARSKISKQSKNKTIRFYALVSIYLVIFLSFNSGFASEVIFKDYGPCIYLSKKRILDSGNIFEKERFFRKYIVEQDVFSAKWLSKYRDTGIIKIYSDVRCRDVLCPYGNFPPNPIEIHYIRLSNDTDIMRSSYIYLRYVSVVEGIVVYSFSPLTIFNTTEIYKIINRKNVDKIYTNGGSYIFYLG